MPHRILAALAVYCLIGSGWAEAETCRASYYWEGRLTASGERFHPDDPNDLTAAHRTLPFGTRVRVTYGSRSITVRINDRGPFVSGRCIDLSRAAARRLGIIGVCVAPVRIDW